MKILIGSSGPADGGQGISSYSKDLVLALKIWVLRFFISAHIQGPSSFLSKII